MSATVRLTFDPDGRPVLAPVSLSRHREVERSSAGLLDVVDDDDDGGVFGFLDEDTMGDETDGSSPSLLDEEDEKTSSTEVGALPSSHWPTRRRFTHELSREEKGKLWVSEAVELGSRRWLPELGGRPRFSPTPVERCSRAVLVAHSFRPASEPAPSSHLHRDWRPRSRTTASLEARPVSFAPGASHENILQEEEGRIEKKKDKHVENAIDQPDRSDRGRDSIQLSRTWRPRAQQASTRPVSFAPGVAGSLLRSSSPTNIAPEIPITISPSACPVSSAPGANIDRTELPEIHSQAFRRTGGSLSAAPAFIRKTITTAQQEPCKPLEEPSDRTAVVERSLAMVSPSSYDILYEVSLAANNDATRGEETFVSSHIPRDPVPISDPNDPSKTDPIVEADDGLGRTETQTLGFGSKFSKETFQTITLMVDQTQAQKVIQTHSNYPKTFINERASLNNLTIREEIENDNDVFCVDRGLVEVGIRHELCATSASLSHVVSLIGTAPGLDDYTPASADLKKILQQHPAQSGFPHNFGPLFGPTQQNMVIDDHVFVDPLIGPTFPFSMSQPDLSGSPSPRSTKMKGSSVSGSLTEVPDAKKAKLEEPTKQIKRSLMFLSARETGMGAPSMDLRRNSRSLAFSGPPNGVTGESVLAEEAPDPP